MDLLVHLHGLLDLADSLVGQGSYRTGDLVMDGAAWKSYIDVVHSGSMMVPLTNMYVVQVNGIPLLATLCASMARKFASLLDVARAERNTHNAMQILVDQIGLCEDDAKMFLEALREGTIPKPTHVGNRSIN